MRETKGTLMRPSDSRPGSTGPTGEGEAQAWDTSMHHCFLMQERVSQGRTHGQAKEGDETKPLCLHAEKHRTCSTTSF